jgi:predicted Zn finger-like uncharacterized protein
MKIVCDACQAKYSISDDKVQGKVFKIRCKKCSNIIVVRGGGGGAAEPAPQPAVEKDTRVYDYGYEGGAPAGDEAVWHVVINQDQVGPMSAAEVQQRFTAGEIDAETYIWREGFADWQPLAQVDAFAAFVQSSAAASPGGGGGADAVASMFGTTGMGEDGGTMRSDPGDLFAAASAGSRRAEDDGGDLFGAKPGTGSRQPVAGGSADAAAAAKLRGERNENSVLFSLNNLAQLASDKPAPVTAPPSSSLGAATGAAGGEGSGLIDIRSMANAYLGGSGAAAKPATSSAIGSIDDLPVFGGTGFSEPAVIVPTARASSNNKMMFALIGAVGLLAVAAVILVVVMLGKGDGDKKEGAVAAADRADKDAADRSDGDKAGKEPDRAPETRPDTAPAGDPPKTADASEPTPADASEPKATDKPKTTPGATTTRPTTTRPTTVATAPKQTERPKPPEPKPAAESGGSCDEVSCVLNNYEGACCQKFRKGGARPSGGTAPKPSGGGDLPDKLDRAMISDGVSKVKARVMACGDKSPAKGQVKVSVKVSPDGSISSVSVTATPDPGLGSCVQSAMQRATFRKTQSGGSFSYPFVF